MRRTVAAFAGLSLVAAALALPPRAGATTTNHVVPSAQAGTEASNANAFPFNCSGGGYSSMRYQQLYNKGDFSAGGEISAVSFRPDGTFGSAFGPTTLPGVTVTLSTSPKAMGSISTTFADNVGSDVVTVYSGDLTLSSAFSGSPPPQSRSFDVTIPLQQHFNYDSTAGNLLLDIKVPTCKSTTYFDVANVMSVDKLFSLNGSDDVSGGASTSDGLVTQFTMLDPSSDTTPPNVAFTDCPTAPVPVQAARAVNFTASDSDSGLATPASGSVSLDTSTIGARSVTTTARDNAWASSADDATNSATATCNYTVVYNFDGFYQGMNGRLNTMKAGLAVPVEFSLDGARQAGDTNTFGVNVLKSAVVDKARCPTNLHAVAVGTTSVTTPKLTYKAPEDEFRYVWRSNANLAGTCGYLVLTFKDASTTGPGPHAAATTAKVLFKFTKK
jgi:hypothetical protein